MFVHINPEVTALGETISTLKFAERVATIDLGAAQSNKEGGEIREFKEEVCISIIASSIWLLSFVLTVSWFIIDLKPKTNIGEKGSWVGAVKKSYQYSRRNITSSVA